ncbi:MAG: CPBP family glutamic-type intramembrane protease [Blastocatellia bacterium]|nr:CPBP family glutamic-type intramembrane protease [Blastocatellia bacterium]
MESQITRFCSYCGSPVQMVTAGGSVCPMCRSPIGSSPPSWSGPEPASAGTPPPWSLGTALALLAFFMLTMITLPPFMIGIWAQTKGLSLTLENMEELMNNPQAALIGVIGVGVVHVLTMFMAWTVVTGWRRRFTEVIAWSWHPRFRFRQALLTVILVYGSSFLLQMFLPSGATEFEELIKTSAAVRLGVAFLAVATAPFVEELVYRGVLYPSLEARLGRVPAIVGISALFALVHFPQYAGSLLVLVSLTLLSLVLTAVRAYTGRLLPCFVIHFVYNLVGATLILLDGRLAS